MTAQTIGRFEIIGEVGQGTKYLAKDNLYGMPNAANDRDDWMHTRTNLAMDNQQGWLIETDQTGLARSHAPAQAMRAKSRA